MMRLKVSEAHLDSLSLVSRFGERLCRHLPAGDFASVFVKVAWDLAGGSRGAALRSDRTNITVSLRGSIQQRASVVHGATGLEQLAIGADVDPTPPVPAKVGT